MKRHPFFSLIVVLTTTLGLIMGVWLGMTPLVRGETPAREEPPARAVRQAWQRAQTIGVYDFSSDIVQITHLAPAVVNAGRTSRRDEVYFEGSLDRDARTMLLTLWKNSGSVATGRDGVEIRIEDGKAFGRQMGGRWQEIDDFSAAFAPSGDPLAFLTTIKHVQRVESGANASRYTFELDGPAFARRIRDQLEEQLRRKGELPAGMTLDTSREYLEMTGSGELWLDARGLPLRLRVHMEFPPQRNGERIEADIITDFAHFGDNAAVAAAFAARGGGERLNLDRESVTGNGAGRTSGLRSSVLGLLSRQLPGWKDAARKLGLFLLALTLALLMVIYRRARQVYAAVVIAVVVSMVVTPLIQSQQAAAFYQRQREKQAARETEQQEQDAFQEARETFLQSDWDAHRNPLGEEAADEGEAVFSDQYSVISEQYSALEGRAAAGGSQAEKQDSDKDGLTDAMESSLATDPNDPDSDDDGLSDGVEALRLGTNPNMKDSDGDGITDGVEVAGFADANGRDWYLDPNSVDSNNDGELDSIECPELVGVDAAAGRACQDTDHDGVPDIFDRDNDDDGVPDRLDLAAYQVVGQDGPASNAHAITPFDLEHPFNLTISQLRANEPVFVDFQLRPVITRHLTYAMNVLDWPANDDDGQIQHVRDTTFASQLTPQERLANPSAANGDMRLIPMLEIELTGNRVPLALTAPEIDVPVRGAISATIHLDEAANQNKTRLCIFVGRSHDNVP